MENEIKSEPLRIIHYDVIIDNYEQEFFLDYNLKANSIFLNEPNLRIGIIFTMKSRLSSKKGQWLGYIAEVKYIIPDVISLLTLNQFKSMIKGAESLYKGELNYIFLEDSLQFSLKLPIHDDLEITQLFSKVLK